MDVTQALKQRRSINFFEVNKPIPEEKVRELFSLANLAPSSFDLQPWKVVVVRDTARKQVLRKCAMNQQKVEDASMALILVADPDGVEENMDRVLDSWQELGYMKQEMRKTYADMMKSLYGAKDSLKRKLFAAKNAALFGMSLMVAAKGIGLETHPMDGFDEDCIKKEFNIPENKIIPMLIAVGYLKDGVTLLPRAFRRDPHEFISYDTYR